LGITATLGVAQDAVFFKENTKKGLGEMDRLHAGKKVRANTDELIRWGFYPNVTAGAQGAGRNFAKQNCCSPMQPGLQWKSFLRSKKIGAESPVFCAAKNAHRYSGTGLINKKAAMWQGVILKKKSE
jgi:hypothetical protein